MLVKKITKIMMFCFIFVYFLFSMPKAVLATDTVYSKQLYNLAQEKIQQKYGYISSTDYLAVVDTTNQRAVIYKKSGSSWRTVQDFECGSGRNDSSVYGVFKVIQKKFGINLSANGNGGNHYFTEYFQAGRRTMYQKITESSSVQHVTVPDSQGFHDSLIVGAGMQSAGCIRLEQQNAKWIYDYVPVNSTVCVIKSGLKYNPTPYQTESILKWAETAGEQNQLIDSSNVDVCNIISNELSDILTSAFFYICVIGIILVIVMTIIDLIKVITGKAEEKLIEFFKKLIARIIVIIILLILPVIITFLINLINNLGNDLGYNKDNPLCGVNK